MNCVFIVIWNKVSSRIGILKQLQAELVLLKYESLENTKVFQLQWNVKIKKIQNPSLNWFHMFYKLFAIWPMNRSFYGFKRVHAYLCNLFDAFCKFTQLVLRFNLRTKSKIKCVKTENKRNHERLFQRIQPKILNWDYWSIL